MVHLARESKSAPIGQASTEFASPDQHWSVAANKYLARVTDEKLHRRLTKLLDADNKTGFFAVVLSRNQPR